MAEHFLENNEEIPYTFNAAFPYIYLVEVIIA